MYVDASIMGKNDEIGFVDSAVLAASKKDMSMDEAQSLEYSAKVKVRTNRPPQIGDKFSSRHG